MNNYGYDNNGYNQNPNNSYGYGNTPNQYSQNNMNGSNFSYNQSYGANNTYGYGNGQGGYDYTPKFDDYGMGGGFESGNAVQMTGIQNIGAIISDRVVAQSFLFMVVGLIITAIAALTTSPWTAVNMLRGSGYIGLIVAEFAVVFIANWAIKRNIPIIAGVLFAVYSYLTGMIFSIFFVAFTFESLATTFFVCAAMFGFMAIYGLVTKTDLTSVGNLFLMALFGIIIGSVVNGLILHSSAVEFGINILAILIFVGLTAYDANKTKKIALMSDSTNALSMSLYCAFELYLDFINLFIRLLSIMGKEK